MDQSGDGGRARPQEEARREHPLHIETVNQPAGKKLAAGVGPEERREQDAELRRRDPEFILEQRSRNRKVAAIDVVDEDGEEEQHQHAREGRSGLLWTLYDRITSHPTATTRTRESLFGFSRCLCVSVVSDLPPCVLARHCQLPNPVLASELEGDSVAGYDSRRAGSQGSRPLPATGSGTAPKTHRHYHG